MYQIEKRDLENAIIERAYKDEEFRHSLTSGDARAAIGKAFGRDVPFNVNVLVDTTSTVNIVLPNFDDSLDVELTDEQLEVVAGGLVGDCWWTCAITSCDQTGCGSTNAQIIE